MGQTPKIFNNSIGKRNLFEMSSVVGQEVSVASYGLRATFALEDEPRFEEMTDEELRRTLELGVRTNKVLAIENDVFERYLNRHDPQCLQTMSQVFEAARDAQKVTSQLMSMSSTPSLTGSGAALSTARVKQIFSPSTGSSQTFTGTRRYGSTVVPNSKSYRITLSHRIEMTNKEIEEMRKDLAELERVTAQRRANLRAQMEEIKLRILETLEAREELENRVVKKGVDPLTGKISAEKFIRFMEEWLKASDSIIEKLRLKRSNIECQIKKANQQLRQSKELGATLDPIDFQQLAIENQDYVNKIEETNQYLLDLKKITGRYSITLTNYKEKLARQLATLASIKKEIVAKQSQIDKLRMDEKTTELEVVKAEEQLARVMQVLDDYTIPNILDLVKTQAELREMKKTYNRLERLGKNRTMALGKLNKQQHRTKKLKMDVN